MDDRNSRYGRRDFYGQSGPQDYGEDYGSGRDYTYSSARDYAAAGEIGSGRRERGHGGYGTRDEQDWRDRGSGYGARSYGDRDRGGTDRYRSAPTGQRAFRDEGDSDRGYARGRFGHGEDRSFLERAGDEVRSWFGDEDAERRREMDQRYDDRVGRGERARDAAGDGHYHAWRRQRIAELDRDYDEYRRENSQRFHNEFTSWRSERQGQRDSLQRVNEHMEVIGSDGSHVGTVDKVRGDRILLTRSDSEAGGHHHSIPSRWIQSVDDEVTLRKSAAEAQAHWRDEDRSGALFGEGDDDRSREDWSSERNLNRSFSGTY
ncbi:hypothetical protein FHS95_003979 [Sphingomonas naasensis]|uniref:DUF2171 domain-containing protein n=1 Tax=Sphingomonas naasensis TaxID=1344951 RepID=A0A4S1WDU6_9SPHN|nr:DUF2171 domain-containing protein [Sphingomonas naasensis]NIJ22264.1 hypothetical protein [Sphingomonas naasensis]TGX40723.1 DUF2171 domain-containing protein [Sphingomonas naasensis]